MKTNLNQWLVGRDSRAGTYFAILFGTAVFTIMAIRGFLAVANYPFIGGDSLHIAHMLWGGLLMLVAVIIFIYTHGHRAKMTGSFIGGVGFGSFIDELGKFITNDNDYFYRPTAMLIYIIFLLLWALLVWLNSYVPNTPSQQFIDAISRLRDTTIHGITPQDRLILKKQFTELGINSKEQTILFGYVKQFAPAYKPMSIARVTKSITNRVQSAIQIIVNSRVTPVLLYVIITLSAVGSFMVLFFALLNKQNILDSYANVPTIIEAGLIISTILSIACVTAGFWYSHHSWYKTLFWYRRAMLVNVFGTQVFLFYINQFTAVFGLAFSLVLLYVLNILVNNNVKR